MDHHRFIPYDHTAFDEDVMLERSQSFFKWMNRRRSLRFFSDKSVPAEVIQNLIRTASTAPSGAHKQPWTFCAVSNPAIKAQIRQAAEKEEYESYHHRMGEEWLSDLAPLGTDWHKPFLETAPWLIAVFKKAYEVENGEKRKCYYVNESVGIAVGFLLAAIHNAGLVALTHTPSPMNFLQHILDRPENERPFLLIPVGYPEEGALVPDLKRKPLEEVAVFY